MDSDSCDFVMSAINLSKYDNAKKLCEILLITDKSNFSLLYGLINIALKNYNIARNVCSTNSFKLGLMSALESQCWDGLEVDASGPDEIIKKIQYESDYDSILMQKLVSGIFI